jgi:CRISPR/Cas system-associated exonuclease Cas4 (RecB family)
MNYSYTQISQYLTCPRRYRHRYREFSVDVRRSEAVTLRQPVMPVFDSFAG